MKKTIKCKSCNMGVNEGKNPHKYYCTVCKKPKFGYETYEFVSLFAKGILIFLLVVSCKSPTYNPDNDPNVLDWYIDGDTIIYTKQDSIKDQYERRKYIDSLFPEN
jgi:hypothetical protein